MSGKNYNQVFKSARVNTQTVDETSDPIVDPVTDIIVDEIVQRLNVINCEKLNIRVEPDITSDVLTIVNKGSKLTILKSESNEDWYSVRTEDDIEGFCMKKYVG